MIPRRRTAAGGQTRAWLLLMLVAMQISVAVLAFLSFPSDERDFLIQMTAGRVSDLDGSRVLYDPEIQLLRQNEIPSKALGEESLLPFNHPPLLLPLLRPLSRIPYHDAYYVWTAGSFFLLVLTTLLLTSDMRKGPSFSGLEAKAAPLAFLAFFPMVIVLVQGQDTGLLLLSLVAWVLLFDNGRDFAAGLALSLAAIRPHLALGLAVPFLFARRKVFFGFALGISILTLYSLSMVGLEGAADLLRLVRQTGVGDGLVIGQSHMPNLQGFLKRYSTTADAGTASGLPWLIWGVFVALTSFWWRRSGPDVTRTHIGLLIIGTALLVPHIHVHDLAMIGIPPLLAATTRFSARRPDWDKPVAALAAASLFLTLMAVSPPPWFDLFLAAAVALITVSSSSRLLGHDAVACDKAGS